MNFIFKTVTLKQEVFLIKYCTQRLCDRASQILSIIALQMKTPCFLKANIMICSLLIMIQMRFIKKVSVCSHECVNYSVFRAEIVYKASVVSLIYHRMFFLVSLSGCR